MAEMYTSVSRESANAQPCTFPKPVLARRPVTWEEKSGQTVDYILCQVSSTSPEMLPPWWLTYSDTCGQVDIGSFTLVIRLSVTPGVYIYFEANSLSLYWQLVIGDLYLTGLNASLSTFVQFYFYKFTKFPITSLSFIHISSVICVVKSRLGFFF